MALQQMKQLRLQSFLREMKHKTLHRHYHLSNEVPKKNNCFGIFLIQIIFKKETRFKKLFLIKCSYEFKRTFKKLTIESRNAKRGK